MPRVNPQDIDLFNAPIPGQSLTAELGSRPWQKPPQLTTVEEVINYYSDKFLEPKVSSDLVTMMSDDIPITVIVDSTMLANVMEGKHTIDVGMLVAPFLVEMCSFLGDEAGIKYTTGLEEEDHQKEENHLEEEEDNCVVDTVAARQGMSEFKSEVGQDTPTEEEEAPEPVKSGLMARGAV